MRSSKGFQSRCRSLFWWGIAYPSLSPSTGVCCEITRSGPGDDRLRPSPLGPGMGRDPSSTRDLGPVSALQPAFSATHALSCWTRTRLQPAAILATPLSSPVVDATQKCPIRSAGCEPYPGSVRGGRMHYRRQGERRKKCHEPWLDVGVCCT